MDGKEFNYVISVSEVYAGDIVRKLNGYGATFLAIEREGDITKITCRIGNINMYHFQKWLKFESVINKLTKIELIREKK